MTRQDKSAGAINAAAGTPSLTLEPDHRGEHEEIYKVTLNSLYC